MDFITFAQDTLERVSNNLSDIDRPLDMVISEDLDQAIQTVLCFAKKNNVNITDLKNRCLTVLNSKRHDYATNKNRYWNFERVANILIDNHIIGASVHTSFLVNIGHKIARIENLVTSKKIPENESVIDSFIDLINYLMLYTGWKLGLQ